MKNRILKIAMVLIIVVASSCSAQNSVSSTKAVDNWEVLGERTINIRADHDEINVGPSRGTFRKLKFKITRASIFIKNVRISYGNGTSKNYKINQTFKKGHFTRVLDLDGNNRVIKTIAFNYTTLNTNKERAKVTAFGKH